MPLRLKPLYHNTRCHMLPEKDKIPLALSDTVGIVSRKKQQLRLEEPCHLKNYLFGILREICEERCNFLSHVTLKISAGTTLNQ